MSQKWTVMYFFKKPTLWSDLEFPTCTWYWLKIHCQTTTMVLTNLNLSSFSSENQEISLFFKKKKKNYRGKGEKIKERMKVESNGEEREGRLFCLTSELPLLHVQTFKKGSHSIHGFHLTLQGQYITSGLFKQIFNPNPLSSWYNPLQLHDLLLHL